MEQPAQPMEAAAGAGEPAADQYCQVPNCTAVGEPNEAKYYRRFRICRQHATMPQVELEGHVARFCQQCGRFQALEDFDGDRRSCRASLDKHNARRRRAATAAVSGIKAYGRAPARTHAPYTTAGSGDARRGGGPSTSAPRRSVPPAAAEQQGQQGQRELEPLLRQDPFLLPAQLQPGGPLAPFAVDGLLPPPGLGFSSSAPLNLASSGSLGSLASSGQLPSLAAAAQVNLSMLSGRELQQLLLRLQAAKAQRAAAAAAPAAAANPWLAPTPDEAGPALKAEPADPLAALLLPPPPPPPQRPAEAAGGGLEGGGAGRGSPDPPSSSFLAAASVPFVSQGAEHPPPITCQPPSQPQLQQPAPQQPGQALHWQLQSLLSSQSLPPTPLPPGGDMPLDHWDLRGVAGSAMESGPARVGSWESQPSRTSRLPSLAAQGSVSQPAPCGAGFDVKGALERVSLRWFQLPSDRLAPHVREGVLKLIEEDPEFADQAAPPF